MMRWLWLGVVAALPPLLAGCDYGLTADEAAAGFAAGEEVCATQAIVRSVASSGRVAAAPPTITPPGQSGVRTVTPGDPGAPEPSRPPADEEVPHSYPGVGGDGMPDPPIP